MEATVTVAWGLSALAVVAGFFLLGLAMGKATTQAREIDVTNQKLDLLNGIQDLIGEEVSEAVKAQEKVAAEGSPDAKIITSLWKISLVNVERRIINEKIKILKDEN